MATPPPPNQAAESLSVYNGFKAVETALDAKQPLIGASASTLLYKDAGGVVTGLLVGTNLSISGGALNATGGGSGGGDVTGPASATADAVALFSGTTGKIIKSGPLLSAYATLANPTFTGTVGLPAGQVVNGVTLSTAAGTTVFLRGDGTYATPSGGGGGGGDVVGPASAIDGRAALFDGTTGKLIKVGGVLTGSNTGDQTITLTGEATGSGTGSFAVTLTNASVIGKVITGYSSAAGTVAATDTILQAINKLNGNDGLKANLASPTFTGTPAAPTASAGTNTTQVATTAFVTTAVTDAKPIQALGFALSDTTTAITTGTAKLTVRMPYAFTLLSGAAGVRASLSTASSSGIPTVDINENGTTILSTKLTIDATEKTSTTAAVPAVISDTSLADDAEITFDIDVAGTGAVGLVVWLIGRRT